MTHSDPPSVQPSDEFSSAFPPAPTNVSKPPPLPPVNSPSPPPPNVRATLPPVRPQTASLPTSSAAPASAASQQNRQAAPPAQAAPPSQTGRAVPPSIPVSPIARESATPLGAVPRWRVAEDPRSENRTTEDAAIPLEPVRRSMPAWLVSMIIHIALLLGLALWTTPLGQGISRVVLEFGEATEQESVELQEFSLESSDSNFDQDDSDSEVPVEVDVQELIDTVELSEPIESVSLDLGAAAMDITVQPMFSGRTGAMKSALLATYGGNQETIDAVERGLRWLARNQEKAGSWSMKGPFDDGSYSENRIAATAMAMLAFQGDGNTHLDGPYKSLVEKGLKYLLSKQSRRDGFFAREAPGHEKAYAQAQASIAICELYAMTKDSSLRAPAQAAVNYAINAQSSEGGWRYEPRQDSDLSVTGWYVMALKSAKSAGLDVSESSLGIINSYLDSVSMFDGAGYSYQKGRPATPAMTAEGLLCRQYLGWPRDQEAMATGIDTLVQDWPIDPSDMNVYYWYYATQTIHHFGGSPWTIWNGRMRVQLPRMQVKRGGESGSWSPQADQWGENSGRLFTTCLSIYCLEVYYRHLPLYQSREE